MTAMLFGDKSLLISLFSHNLRISHPHDSVNEYVCVIVTEQGIDKCCPVKCLTGRDLGLYLFYIFQDKIKKKVKL